MFVRVANTIYWTLDMSTNIKGSMLTRPFLIDVNNKLKETALKMVLPTGICFLPWGRKFNVAVGKCISTISIFRLYTLYTIGSRQNWRNALCSLQQRLYNV